MRALTKTSFLDMLKSTNDAAHQSGAGMVMARYINKNKTRLDLYLGGEQIGGNLNIKEAVLILLGVKSTISSLFNKLSNTSR